MVARTTLAVSSRTRNRLKHLGSKRETYDEILQRLMDFAEERAFYRHQMGILTGSKFHSLDEV